jgi:oligoribonuclease (3'-5' exoribonuclease)
LTSQAGDREAIIVKNDVNRMSARLRMHVGMSKRPVVGRTPTSPEAFSGFQKSSTHLALDDIRDSIREMQHYRLTFLRVP